MCIHILVRHTLKEHFRPYADHSLDAQTALDGIMTGSKCPHRPAERLMGHVLYLLRRKPMTVFTLQDGYCRYLFAYYQIVGSHHTILAHQYRLDIHIKLSAHQAYEHTHEIGNKKPQKLPTTSMASQ